MSPAFCHYIGIDYSGAETPTASLKGLRVYHAEGPETPTELPPPPSSRRYWTRRGVAEWLITCVCSLNPNARKGRNNIGGDRRAKQVNADRLVAMRRAASPSLSIKHMAGCCAAKL
jgi:hypothetical protein